jgi:hypothetical protein
METNSKNKNIQESHEGKNDFKKGYQPKIQDEICNLFADSQGQVE